MKDTVDLWLALANQLMLAFALVFVVGLLIGIIAGRRRRHAARPKAAQGQASIEDHPKFDDLVKFHARAQGWPNRQRK